MDAWSRGVCPGATATWERWFSIQSGDAARESESGSDRQSHTRILPPLAGPWPEVLGLRPHRASASPACDSVGGVGMNPGQGLRPGLELASRRSALLGHQLFATFLSPALATVPSSQSPKKPAVRGNKLLTCDPYPSYDSAFGGRHTCLQIPSSRLARDLSQPPDALQLFPCLQNRVNDLGLEDWAKMRRIGCTVPGTEPYLDARKGGPGRAKAVCHLWFKGTSPWHWACLSPIRGCSDCPVLPLTSLAPAGEGSSPRPAPSPRTSSQI